MGGRVYVAAAIRTTLGLDLRPDRVRCKTSSEQKEHSSTSRRSNSINIAYVFTRYMDEWGGEHVLRLTIVSFSFHTQIPAATTLYATYISKADVRHKCILSPHTQNMDVSSFSCAHHKWINIVAICDTQHNRHKTF